MRRFGQRVGIRPECLAEYKRHHAAIWPEIAAAIQDAGIRNYSIFACGTQLVGYFEYEGPDEEYVARMERLASAPRMREWWDLMEPMQVPDPQRARGTWWTDMEEVFHLD